MNGTIPVKTIVTTVLLVSVFVQISVAQTSSSSSSAPQTPPASSSETSTVPSREIWVDGGWSINSQNAIGTDQISGGSSNDLQVNGGALVAVRFDWNQGNHFGHEVQYMNGRMPIQYNYEENATEGAALNRFGYNFLGYFSGRESKVRFFGTVGTQLTNYSRPSDSEIGCEAADCTEAGQPPATGGNNKFGLNYGVGMKVHFTPKLSLRFDVRQYVNSKPFNLRLASGLLFETEVSAGFGIGF
jgi:hypothetical protein